MYLCIILIHNHSSLEVVGGGGGEVTSQASGIWKGRDFIRLAKKVDLKSFTFSAESKQSDLLRLSQKSASGASFLENTKG